jgi:predicted RND superfamily exporter protein
MWEWLLERYARFALRRPWIVFGIIAVFTIGSAVVAPRLKVVTSRSKLVSEDNPYQRHANELVREFGWNDTLVVLVDGDTPEKARLLAERIATKLEAEKDVVRAVFHRIDLDTFRNKALLYVPVEALRRAEKAISSGSLRVADMVRVKGLVPFLEGMEGEVTRSLRGEGAPVTDIAEAAPMMRGFTELFDELARWLRDPAHNEFGLLAQFSPERFLRGDGRFDHQGYLTSPDRKTVLLFVYPTMMEDSSENQLVLTERVRKISRAEAAAMGGKVGTTGLPASVAEEMLAVNRESTLIGVASFLGVAVILIIAYGFSLRVLLALLPAVLGMIWTFGFTAVAIGHLSLLSSAFSAVLFGLGTDFAIHLIARFEEEWARGADARNAAVTAIGETGASVVTEALTAAIAFYTTMLVEVDAFGELGVIAGTGLLLTALAAFLMLPTLLVYWTRLQTKRAERRKRPSQLARGKVPGLLFKRLLGIFLLRRPGVVIGIAVAVTAILLVKSQGIPFDYDLMNLLPRDSESAQYYRRLLETTKVSSEFNAVIARSLDEVRAKTSALERLPSVGKVESAGLFLPPGVPPSVLARTPRSRDEALEPFIPGDQPEKLTLLRKVAPRIEALPDPTASPEEIDPKRLAADIGKLQAALERVLEAAPPVLVKDLGATLRALGGLEKALREAGARAGERLNAFQREIFAKMREAVAFVKKAVRAQEPLTVGDLQRATGGLFDRLVGKSGHYAVYAFPKGTIWDREFLTRFISETRQVDAEVTGFPVNYHYFSDRIRSGFRWAALYAAIAIFVLLLIEFRNLLYAVLASVPLLLGAGWMLGLMGIFGLEYNHANVVALPLILGMGVEYGSEIVHRFKESADSAMEAILTTNSRAVTIAALTTVVGLGTMGLASHRGLASMGLILVIGVSACLLTSVVVLPCILHLYSRWRARRVEVQGRRMVS